MGILLWRPSWSFWKSKFDCIAFHNVTNRVVCTLCVMVLGRVAPRYESSMCPESISVLKEMRYLMLDVKMLLLSKNQWFIIVQLVQHFYDQYEASGLYLVFLCQLCIYMYWCFFWEYLPMYIGILLIFSEGRCWIFKYVWKYLLIYHYFWYIQDYFRTEPIVEKTFRELFESYYRQQDHGWANALLGQVS